MVIQYPLEVQFIVTHWAFHREFDSIVSGTYPIKFPILQKACCSNKIPAELLLRSLLFVSQ